MLPTLTLALLATHLLGTAAINLQRRTDGQPPRVVKYDLQRVAVDDPIARDRRRLRAIKRGTVSASLANHETLYLISGTLGTPPQTVNLHIDTGSSDLWVNVPNSAFCESATTALTNCAQYGTYNPNSSSTYKYVNSLFNITYQDTTGAAGDYATDTFTFADTTITNQQFGIGYSSSTSDGVLGIGYQANEAVVRYTQGRTYPNVPSQLVQQGYINTNAYSLWLNDLDAQTGTILFGGVDKSKYEGELATLPIIPTYGVYAQFIVAMTAVGADGNSTAIAHDIAVPALLDSGTSLTYLPTPIANAIFQAVGASYNENTGFASVSCNLANVNATFDFTFSSPTIRVPLNQLVLVESIVNGVEHCILGIGPGGDSMSILGDTFLRSAYVVYDLSANQISLAQTIFSTSSAYSNTEDVLEITSSSGVPGASVVPNAVTAISYVTGANGMISITSPSAAEPTAAPGGLLNWALIGAAGMAAAAAL